MSNKKWHLCFSPGTDWSSNYDRLILPQLKRGTERDLYERLDFDFNPYINLDQETFEEMSNDSAFIENANRAFLPMRDKMLADIIAMVKKYAEVIRKERRQRRARMEAQLSHLDLRSDNPLAGNLAVNGLLKPPAKSLLRTTAEKLTADLVIKIYTREEEFEEEAEKQIAAWKNIPLVIQQNNRDRNKKRAIIGVKIGVSTLGAGLATTGAVFSGGLAIMGAIGAWYGLVRTLVGSAQELHTLRASADRLLREIHLELAELKQVTNPTGRAVAAGVATGFTGGKLVNTTSRLTPKVNQLKSKVPKLKMAESELGKQLNALLNASEKLKRELAGFDEAARELHAAHKISDEKLASLQEFINYTGHVDSAVLDAKSREAMTRRNTSFNLEQVIRDVEAGLTELKREQGVWPDRLESVVSLLISVGLSSGVAGGAASGGIDTSAIGGLMDTIGLPAGGLADVYSIAETIDENVST